MKHEAETIMRITAHYVEEFQAGKSPSLAAYLQRYPQYQSEILDFVAYYHAFESPLPLPSASSSLSDVSRAALDRAYALIEADAASAPLHSLLVNRQQDIQQLADALELSPSIIYLLEQHTLDPASLPRALSTRLSHVLGYSVTQVSAFLADEQSSRRNHSSDRKVAEQRQSYSQDERVSQSSPARQTFVQALLASSDLSPQHRQTWLAILAQEDETPAS